MGFVLVKAVSCQSLTYTFILEMEKTSMYYKPGAKNKCLHRCLCFSLTGWHQNTVLLQQRPLDLERWLRALSDFVESSGLNSLKTNMVAHKLCNFSFKDLTFSAVLPRQWTDMYVQVNIHMNKIKINKSLKYHDYICWYLLLFEKNETFYTYTFNNLF